MKAPNDDERFAVEVRNLRVSLAGHEVLKGVNLVVPRGKLVALIGPNGAGKTTLLRCLLGLQQIDSGEILLLGEKNLRRALPRVGYVPQRLAVDPGFILSVREFLSLRLRETAHWFWQRHATTDLALGDLVGDLGIRELLSRPLGRVSGGQLQRILIAFSLLARPELLLLDEPTTGVDTPGEIGFYDLISRIQQRNQLTVILVSHDLSMVHRQASWVYALNGVICCEGSPEQILTAESLKEAYGIHLSPYQHHHVH